MFSSNPFSQLPSTNVFSPPNSLLDCEKDNLYQQIDNPFISSDFVCHAYSCPAQVTGDETALIKDFLLQHQFSERSGSEDHEDLLDSVISSYKKKMTSSKRDGQSKIYTARGPRDRRVRLSIDIARKFFCLQDLLGFDKASKTLDWLLTKSLTAIKDLVEQSNHCSSSTVTDESKVKFLETIKGDSDGENRQKNKSPPKSAVDGKRKKTTQNLSREQSRAEARARARERTKQKFRVKSLDDCESGCCGQPEQQNLYNWDCARDQENSKQSKDSSFQIRASI